MLDSKDHKHLERLMIMSTNNDNSNTTSSTSRSSSPFGRCGHSSLVMEHHQHQHLQQHHVPRISILSARQVQCICLGVLLLFAVVAKAAETSSAVAIVEVAGDGPTIMSTSTTTPPTTTTKRSKKTKTSTSSSSTSKRKSGTSRARGKKKKLDESSRQAEDQPPVRPDTSHLPAEHTCLMSDVCVREGRLSACFKPHAPVLYDRDDRSTEDFYEMLMESCPHFFDKNENLHHPLCCSTEQEEIIARLNANIDLIRRTCPSCLINVKKYFCNLFCAPNQRDLLRIDQVRGETVVAISYAVGEQFVHNFFQSCSDVRVFGAYLLDYEYGCGKLKRANCTPTEFMRVLGSLSEMPFAIESVIVPEHRTPLLDKSQGEWPRAVMNDTAYRCEQAPPNMMPCHCEHCARVCSPEKRLAIHGEHEHRVAQLEGERDRPNSLESVGTKAKYQPFRSAATMVVDVCAWSLHLTMLLSFLLILS